MNAATKFDKVRKKGELFLKNRFAGIKENAIIVLGNQKSGTSAIAQLLADFGGLSKTIDIPPIWDPVVFNRIINGEIDFSSFVNRNRFYFSTDLIKEPNLTFLTDNVMKKFAKARYLFVVRDPRDNIRSHLNRINIPGSLEDFVLLPSGLEAATGTVDGGTNYVAFMAHKWNRAVDSYLLYQDRMLLARYEDFLKDKYRYIVRLAGALGVREKADISGKLNLPFQPPGNNSLPWEDYFDMGNLQLIEDICCSRMMRLGYSTHAD